MSTQTNAPHATGHIVDSETEGLRGSPVTCAPGSRVPNEDEALSKP